MYFFSGSFHIIFVLFESTPLFRKVFKILLFFLNKYLIWIWLKESPLFAKKVRNLIYELFAYTNFLVEISAEVDN